MAGGNCQLKGAVDGVPFQKKDPRINRQGRPRKLPDLNKLLIQVLGDNREDKTAMEMILLALRRKAMKGDTRSAEILLDRAYGKLRQSTDVDVSFDITKMAESEITKLLNRLITKDNVKET